MGQNLQSAMTRMLFRYAAATHSQYTLYTEPKTAKDRLAQVAPPDNHIFSGIPALSKIVQPAPLEAIWYPSPPPQHAAELEKQKVVLHFPGGAFVIAFGHDGAGQMMADAMKHMKATRAIWAQYRLAGTPETTFPAALQDALTFYNYVLSLCVPSENIILCGDSAGGNVAIALLRYLEMSQPQLHLPLPGGVIVFSPWVHVTSCAGQDYNESSHSQSDILLGSLIQWGADAYRHEGQLAEAEPYISPLHNPFKTSVQLFIHAGMVEGFYESIKSFADEMIGLNGDEVRFSATEWGPHCLLLAHEAFGMTNELNSAIKEACEFLG